MNTGDNAFVLLCAALVFLMTPALAFFYGGLVRRKNVVNTMMACAGVMGLSVVLWIVIGFSPFVRRRSRRHHWRVRVHMHERA